MRLRFATAIAAVSLMTLAGCNSEPAATDDTETAATAGSIDGTWVADLDSVSFETKPDERLLQDGTYTCSSCTPPLEVAADGEFHSVADRDYADSMAVEVEDASTVVMRSQKDGRDMGENTYKVSPDGKTLTVSFTDTSVADAAPVTGSYTQTRVADGPAGAHAISGSWQMAKYNDVSREALTVTFAQTGDTLKMSSPAGTSFDATIGGEAVPVQGDVAGTTVKVEKVGDNVFRETSTRDGEIVNVTEYTVDGDTMHVVSSNPKSGSTFKYDANRS